MLVALLLCPLAVQAAETPVILISIDTLRADHVTRLRTPNIESFAEAHGTLYGQIDAQIPLTLPSHTVLMTSRYPFSTGVESNDAKVPPGTVTIASILHANGYATAAFIGSMVLNRSFGLDQGSIFTIVLLKGRAGRRTPIPRVRRDGALVTRAARQWMEEIAAGPCSFSCIFRPAYAISAAGDGRDAVEAAGYDAQLGMWTVTRALPPVAGKEGWWDKSLVIVLGDHGESLGEHGETSHGYFTYESTLHVPSSSTGRRFRGPPGDQHEKAGSSTWRRRSRLSAHRRATVLRGHELVAHGGDSPRSLQ